MENCLVRVARRLNEENSHGPWEHQGLAPRANDLDIVIALEHVELADMVLHPVPSSLDFSEKWR